MGEEEERKEKRLPNKTTRFSGGPARRAVQATDPGFGGVTFLDSLRGPRILASISPRCLHVGTIVACLHNLSHRTKDLVGVYLNIPVIVSFLCAREISSAS